MTAPLAVGLTGGIGSGKTAVADAFARLGVPVVDTDLLAHELSRRSEAGYQAIVERFGAEFVDASGELDRAKLRRRAFDDATVRHDLEALLHPLIRARAEAAIARWTAPYGIVVVPLLFERGGLRERVARVLVVDCSEDEQIRRVRARSGLTEAEVRAIMATQLARDARLAGADDVIDNSGSPDRIGPQVAALDQRYRELARGNA
ncbi:MAG TPA: dephospho-CoA kinase [Casimicrobiaceae bacterium]